MLTILCLAAITAEEPFKVTLKRDSDRVTITSAKEQTTFAIHSPFGISEATIERRQERWPKRVVLRLSLNGLENFHASNGERSLSAAVSSTDGGIRVWKDDQENSPLKPGDPTRPEIRRLDRDGKPTENTVRGGAFEITLPKAFLEKNPKSLTIRWIDFYRN